MDYGYMASQASWSLRETLNIWFSSFKDNHPIVAGSDSAYYEYLAIQKDHIASRLKKNLKVFVEGDIFYEKFILENNDLDDNGDYIPKIDFNKTAVNIKSFVRWACSEQIPLPPEIINIVTGNGTGNINRQSSNKDDGADDGPAKVTKMITLGTAKTKIFNQLRMISVPFPGEQPDDHNKRVLETVKEMLWHAIINTEIKMKLYLKSFDGWDNGLVFESDEGGYEAYSYEKSLVERDKLMQLVNEMAPDLLILKDTSYGTTVLEENKCTNITDNLAPTESVTTKNPIIPGIDIDVDKPAEKAHILRKKSVDIVDVSEQGEILADPKVETATDSQYCFIKSGQSWNIQFGEIKLPGLRHMTGMDYIKILLQNPYDDISVLELRSMMNPDHIKSSREKLFTEYMGSNEDDNLEGSELSEESNKMLNSLSEDDRELIKTHRKQLLEYKTDLEEATLHNDLGAKNRLTELKNMLEESMYAIIKSRNSDTELGRNRGNVWKNIEDARLKIQAAEISKGYVGTPIYTYLKKYIETGSTCKYNPLVEDPIHWIF